MKKIVLGLDPGSRNFGASLVEFCTENRKLTVLRSEVLTKPVHDLTNFVVEATNFRKEIHEWVTNPEMSVNGIVAERFQSRGLKGSTVECVSVMLGLIHASHDSLPFKVITAANWKTPLQKRFQLDLKEVYHEYRFDIPAHQIDAAFIAVYGVEQAFGAVHYNPYQIIEQSIQRSKK